MAATPKPVRNMLKPMEARTRKNVKELVKSEGKHVKQFRKDIKKTNKVK